MTAIMHTVSLVCAILAAALLGFAWWGLGTEAGQHAYDEMAGIVPAAAGLLGGLLVACAIGAWWLGRARRTGLLLTR